MKELKKLIPYFVLLPLTLPMEIGLFIYALI